MTNIQKRLELAFAVLQTLDYCRDATGNPVLGASVERAIVEKELADTLLCTEIDAADHEIERLSRAVRTPARGLPPPDFL